MRNQRTPEARSYGEVPASVQVDAERKVDRRRATPDAGHGVSDKSSTSRAGAAARRRRKPFVL